MQTANGALWRHFVMHGEHEGRRFRFSCTPQLPSDAKAAYAEAQALAQAAAGTIALPQTLLQQPSQEEQQQQQSHPGHLAICAKLFGSPFQVCQ